MMALVTGATGFVGSHLVRALLSRGDSVRILARTAERAAPLQAAGAEVRLGDVGIPETLDHLADNVEVVFHLASAMYGRAEAFDRVDVQGTERLLIEAERAGARRVVYAGTLACYPLAQQRDGAVIDERCPFDATGLLGHYARAKTTAEKAVLAVNRGGKVEGVIVRLGLVCGAGGAVFPPHVCQVLARDRVILFGDGSVPLPLVYVDNAVDALILGAITPGIAGESFNIVDNEVVTQREYLELLKECTGGTPQVLRLPGIAYYVIAALAELAAAARHKEPATNRYRVRTRFKRVRWDCTKARRRLQWSPHVPLREGLRQAFLAHAQAAVE